MLSPEALQRIRRLQISSSRLVSGLFAGEYRSSFRGRGMEFVDVREYQPGDDVRFIDWNVTARCGRPFAKQFAEERQLTVMLLLDVSPSFRFGTRSDLKCGIAAEICALLAVAALKNNDRAGLALFSDRVESFVPPEKGDAQQFRIIREMLEHRPVGGGTDLAAVLGHLDRLFKRRKVLVIFSDFLSPDYRRALAIAARKHEVIAVTIIDPVELQLPDAGIVDFRIAESGEHMMLDTSARQVRDACRERFQRLRAERRSLFSSLGVDHLELLPGANLLHELLGFFRKRQGRR